MRTYRGQVSATLRMIVLMLLAWITPGQAGQFYEQNRVALNGYDVVAYFTVGQAVKGFSRFSADYLGSTFYFSTMNNRETFSAAPERFAPQYGGYCAFGVAKGYKATIDPESFTIVDGKLYLNYSPSVLAGWRKNISGYIRQADQNWPEVTHQAKVHE
ncbi:MAG: YHS domain protein [Nitrospira sp.]|nr:YHS domain protein [Nitrospira sp.]